MVGLTCCRHHCFVSETYIEQACSCAFGIIIGHVFHLISQVFVASWVKRHQYSLDDDYIPLFAILAITGMLGVILILQATVWIERNRTGWFIQKESTAAASNFFENNDDLGVREIEIRRQIFDVVSRVLIEPLECHKCGVINADSGFN